MPTTPQPRLATILAKLEAELGRPRWRGPQRDPVDELIATVLSQATSDLNSERAFEALKARYPDWPSLARAPLRSIESTIRHGGLAKQKSRVIRNLLRTIERDTGGLDLWVLYELPIEVAMRRLCAYDGVGPKSAACVLMFGGGKDISPVDTHVHRICRRLEICAPTASASRCQTRLGELLASGEAYPAHINFIRFGRERCHAQRPQCLGCPLYRFCRWEDKSKRRDEIRAKQSG